MSPGGLRRCSWSAAQDCPSRGQEFGTAYAHHVKRKVLSRCDVWHPDEDVATIASPEHSLPRIGRLQPPFLREPVKLIQVYLCAPAFSQCDKTSPRSGPSKRQYSILLLNTTLPTRLMLRMAPWSSG
jgi:hypothetical protein